MIREEHEDRVKSRGFFDEIMVIIRRSFTAADLGIGVCADGVFDPVGAPVAVERAWCAE